MPESKEFKNAKKAKISRTGRIAEIAEIADAARAPGIADTEVVRLLKTLKIQLFLKKDRFFGKHLIFFRLIEGGKNALECVSIDIISLKCLYHSRDEVLSAKKQQKISNVGKVGKLVEEEVLS